MAKIISGKLILDNTCSWRKLVFGKTCFGKPIFRKKKQKLRSWKSHFRWFPSEDSENAFP